MSARDYLQWIRYENEHEQRKADRRKFEYDLLDTFCANICRVVAQCAGNDRVDISTFRLLKKPEPITDDDIAIFKDGWAKHFCKPPKVNK